MSYDIQLNDQITGKILELDSPHQMKGGTYQVGGSPSAELNITYNYATHFHKLFGNDGIRILYGTLASDTIPILEEAISTLGDDSSNNYWDPTDGNVKQSLTQLLALAKMRPDGIWDGD